jgi:hypothetical protein
LEALEVVTLIFGEQAGDCRQAPVFVGLVELCRGNPLIVESSAQRFKPMLVSDRQVDVGGMTVGWATKLVGVFNGGMASLNSLLREGEIAAGDCVEIGLGDLGLHDGLHLQMTSFAAW